MQLLVATATGGHIIILYKGIEGIEYMYLYPNHREVAVVAR